MWKKVINISAGLAVMALVMPAHAQTNCALQDQACVLDVIWTATETLPVKKQARLKGDMLKLVAATNDNDLISNWENRLGQAVTSTEDNWSSFANDKASRAIADYGWDGFMRRARTRQAPFNLGRPEVMAAGVRLSDSPRRAEELMRLMEQLAVPNVSAGGGGDNFEKSDFGHNLAELSMERCQLEMFDRAVALTEGASNLRYDLWRARINGSGADAVRRITDEASADDTRHVRQAMEGYGAIIRNGMCATAATTRTVTASLPKSVVVSEPRSTPDVPQPASPPSVPAENTDPVLNTAPAKKKPWYKWW